MAYLGYILEEGTQFLSLDRVQAIQNISQPQTKKQMQVFWGAVGFCRPWIAGFGELAKPILNSTHQDQAEPLQWTVDQMTTSEKLKQALLTAPALGLPNYDKPFIFHVHEREGTVSGVLTQELGGQPRPVAYYPMQLDPVMSGSIPGMRAMAAAAALIHEVKIIVLGHPLEGQIPCEIETSLTNHVNQALSSQHPHKYEATLLTADNITLKRCNTLNSASLLPLPPKGLLHHDCVEVIQESGKIGEDLQDTPLAKPNLNLYLSGHGIMGFAATTESKVLLSD